MCGSREQQLVRTVRILTAQTAHHPNSLNSPPMTKSQAAVREAVKLMRLVTSSFCLFSHSLVSHKGICAASNSIISIDKKCSLLTLYMFTWPKNSCWVTLWPKHYVVPSPNRLRDWRFQAICRLCRLDGTVGSDSQCLRQTLLQRSVN